MRSITFRSGAKCETNDNEAVDALSRLHRGSARGSWVHRLETRWQVALGAVLILAAVAAASIVWGIPIAARYIAERFPDQLALEIGAGTLGTLDRTVFEESALSEEDQARLRAAFAQMAAHEPELPLHLEFRALGVPNAFALPDGTVIVTDELVELADTDQEVLAVLAHEIGHVRHRHSLRMALEATSVALLASVYFGDAAQLSTILAALPAVYTEASYSRTHEKEADTYALEFMAETGLDPQHFADIMTKLQIEMDSVGEEPAALRYLSSHPPTKDRIARFQGHSLGN
jgi:Zn-dependent protease with chaperone function